MSVNAHRYGCGAGDRRGEPVVQWASRELSGVNHATALQVAGVCSLTGLFIFIFFEIFSCKCESFFLYDLFF